MSNMVTRLSRTPGAVGRTGAAHGADTAEVLAEIGIGPEELQRLREQEVV